MVFLNELSFMAFVLDDIIRYSHAGTFGLACKKCKQYAEVRYSLEG